MADFVPPNWQEPEKGRSMSSKEKAGCVGLLLIAAFAVAGASIYITANASTITSDANQITSSPYITVVFIAAVVGVILVQTIIVFMK